MLITQAELRRAVRMRLATHAYQTLRVNLKERLIEGQEIEAGPRSADLVPMIPRIDWEREFELLCKRRQLDPADERSIAERRPREIGERIELR